MTWAVSQDRTVDMTHFPPSAAKDSPMGARAPKHPCRPIVGAYAERKTGKEDI